MSIYNWPGPNADSTKQMSSSEAMGKDYDHIHYSDYSFASINEGIKANIPPYSQIYSASLVCKAWVSVQDSLTGLAKGDYYIGLSSGSTKVKELDKNSSYNWQNAVDQSLSITSYVAADTNDSGIVKLSYPGATHVLFDIDYDYFWAITFYSSLRVNIGYNTPKAIVTVNNGQGAGTYSYESSIILTANSKKCHIVDYWECSNGKTYTAEQMTSGLAVKSVITAYETNLTFTPVYKESTHSYTSKVTTPATCISTGVRTYTCSSCGKSYTEPIAKDPNNHTGGTEVRNAKTATCSAEGYTGDTYCKGCGAKISSGSTIAKKSHTEVTVSAVAATCTATGLTEGKKCSVCGTVTVAQTTVAKNPNNHSGSQVTLSAVAPTCTATGLTEGKKWSCCNAIITAQQTVPAKGHNYTSQVIAATAAVDGYTLHTCQNGCGSSYKDNYTINKIFIGTSQPKKIYFGTQEVKEVYFGTTKVYGKR